MNLIRSNVLDVFVPLVIKAGDVIMAHYADADGAVLSPKADDSPLTMADLAADEILFAGLNQAFPNTPIVSEEQAASHGETGMASFFLVDPLDGTKEFISKNGEFTVNVALIENGQPVVGIVYAPVLGRLFLGATELGASEITITEDRRTLPEGTPFRVRTAGATRAAVASRSHRTSETDEFLKSHQISECVSAGSSLKFCLVATGEADVYPRFGPTMEWDTGAGHAVLVAAGGMVCNLDGSPLEYGKPNYRNPYFVAIGCQKQTIAFS